MNFRPELAAKVMAGSKTVTRRLCSDNERSPWFVGGCSLKVGGSYAVCPGRGKNAIGRVRVTSVEQMPLAQIDDADARREGFLDVPMFLAAIEEINGAVDLTALVWRVEFVAERLEGERE